MTSHDISNTWSCKVTLQIKYIISPIADDIWVLDKVVNYHDRLPPLKSYEHLIT